MPQSEQLEVLVLGSGTGGKLIAWYMAPRGADDKRRNCSAVAPAARLPL
jgi:hypothetical protein